MANSTNNYAIYLGNNCIATVDGTEIAYEAYHKTVELAEMLGKSASLVWVETGEVVACSDDDDTDYDHDYEPDVDECGFDPYEGCYTYDC
jgi:hypothetical protein